MYLGLSFDKKQTWKQDIQQTEATPDRNLSLCVNWLVPLGEQISKYWIECIKELSHQISSIGQQPGPWQPWAINNFSNHLPVHANYTNYSHEGDNCHSTKKNERRGTQIMIQAEKLKCFVEYLLKKRRPRQRIDSSAAASVIKESPGSKYPCQHTRRRKTIKLKANFWTNYFLNVWA